MDRHLFKKKKKFCFAQERTHAQVGEGQREGGRERIPSRLCVISSEPVVGLELTNHEIMT